jgi:SAM-dependent methyltransferase
MDAEGLNAELRELRAQLSSSRAQVTHLRREVRDLRASKSWRITGPLRRLDDLLHRRWPRGPQPSAPSAVSKSQIEWGELARVTPVSDIWGIDRGLPVDRYYIGQFLSAHRTDMRGRVLEIKDRNYATSIGGVPSHSVDVLDIDATNPHVTLIADLEQRDFHHAAVFDCFILTQTLHIIYDLRTALRNAVRLLAPGGVLLCTIPAVSRVNYENGGLESGDYWRLTAAAVRRLFADTADLGGVEIATYGNVQVCAAFLYGLATEDLDDETLRYADPWFPLVHCIRAVKT